jgi:hypothetical protein
MNKIVATDAIARVMKLILMHMKRSTENKCNARNT